MVLLLAACATSPSSPPTPPAPADSSRSPPAPADPAQASPRPGETWTLVGLADDSHFPLPALPGGRALLGPACYDVNQRLTALDPRHPGLGPPCGVERWSAGSETMDLLWAGDAALLRTGSNPPGGLDGSGSGPDERARGRWNAVGSVLGACLGPPLNLPPAGDPAGRRGTDGTSWLIDLSGANRCALSGRLSLGIRGDRADTSELLAGGLGWASGGATFAARQLDPAADAGGPR